MISELLPNIKEHLCTYTYAEERPLGNDVPFDKIIEASCLKLRHSVSKSAYSRQYHPIWQDRQLIGPIHNANVSAAMFQRSHHIEQVTDAVIDYGDFAHKRTSNPKL